MSPDLSHPSTTLTNGVTNSTTTLTSLTLPSTTSFSLGSTSGGSVGGKKPADGSTAPPRVDLEPIYEALRAGLSVEQWLQYKGGLSSFIMGRINRQELSNIIDPIITGPKQRLHNQLLLGIYTNASSRDSPPHEIAPYVLATNRASTAFSSRGLRGGVGPSSDSGDARVEARLKTEVMSLAPRDRRRIKELPEANPEDLLPSLLLSYHQAKQIKIPDPDIPPQSATPNALNNKTNWEAEIKSRYTLPLACESGEFPDLEGIKMRMLPICYEEGVVGGVGDNTAQFMNVAAEVFVKEILSVVISRVRCNRATTVKTDSFKRKMEKMMEESEGNSFGLGFGGSAGMALTLNGSINTISPPSSSLSSNPGRSKKRQKILANGKCQLTHSHFRRKQPYPAPCELAGERKVLCMNDLRLSFTLGDTFLTQLPLSLNRIMAGGWEKPEDYYSGAEYNGMPPPSLPASHFNSRGGKSQPNFAQPRRCETHAQDSMLDVLVSGAGPLPSQSSVSSAASSRHLHPPNPIPSQSQFSTGEHSSLFVETPPAVTVLDGEIYWNDGFEPWGPGFNFASMHPLPCAGGISGQNINLEFNQIDINEIINGWGFYAPPIELQPGAPLPEWPGGGADERKELRGLLDDCLAVGI